MWKTPHTTFCNPRNTWLAIAAGLIWAGTYLAAFQAGTLSGQLRSSDGTSVANIRVAAMFADDGKGRIVASTNTDAQGRYILAPLAPGRYYILAGLTDSLFYYPGVNSTSAAQAVTVGIGTNGKALDFAIRKVGVTVSGRVVTAARVNGPVTVTLSSNGATRETSAVSYGSFEFERVLPGVYQISTSPDIGIGLVRITVKTDNIQDLELKPPSLHLYSVSGRIKQVYPDYPVNPGPRELMLTPHGMIMNTPFPAPGIIQPDGSFIVRNVHPGSYVAMTSAYLLSPEIPVEITDHDISGLEIPVTRQVPLSVHVAMDDGTLLPAFGGQQRIRIQLMMEATQMSSAIGPEGTERTFIKPGRNYVFLTPPPGYYLTSMTTGDADLFKEPLMVDPGATEIKIEARIGRSPLASQPSISVKGKVTGNHPGMALQLFNTGDTFRTPFTTFTTANGTFEFSGVGPGVYNLSISSGVSIITGIIAVGKNVEGLEVSLPPGIIVVGQLMGIPATAPGFPPHLSMEFDDGNEPKKRVDLLPGYGFIYALPAGSYRVSVQGMPPGFLVKAMTAGGTDLLLSPLSIDDKQRTPTIQFMLDYNVPTQ